MKYRLAAIVVCCCAAVAQAQQPPAPSMSEQAAATVMAQWPNGNGEKWNYEEATALNGMDAAWFATADRTYYTYLKMAVDRFVDSDGNIKTYDEDDYSLDNVAMGRQLLLLYGVTGKANYYKAATHLYDQLQKQPRIAEGGFWHKKRYPSQMWLDGLYMAEPFYAEYAATFHHTADFDDIAKQFALLEQHTRDPRTGLLYHAWDESKQQRWANKQTGNSATMWSRAMGWYAMGLVDTLDYMPTDSPQHAELVAMLQRFSKAILARQDAKTGVWYQITDRPSARGNYLESSASAMFVYALLKGVRKGYLPQSDWAAAQKGYQGIISQFVSTDAKGMLGLRATVGGTGLGGEPYRDGSVAYYTSVPKLTNDPRGLGPFILASTEMEMLPNVKLGMGRTVLLDSWFDSETRKDITGATVPFHYKWEERDNNGYSFFGHAFRSYGVQTRTLYTAPTAQNLAVASIYVIVDPNFDTTPDNPHYNPHPNFIQPKDADAIAEWVKQGGVLLLFANDVHNSEFDHLNILASKFGITFNKDLRNTVDGNKFEMGKLTFNDDNPVFKTARAVYMKEICTFATKPPAQAILTDKGDKLIVIANYGKGKVFAVGDPWVYNEYTDGRKLPGSYQNYQAALDMVRWAVQGGNATHGKSMLRHAAGVQR